MNSSESANIDDRIVELVQNFWEQHHLPLLLSRLGGEDKGTVATHAKREAGNLARYLNDRLANRVRVIRHSNKSVLIAAVPFEVEIASQDLDEALEQTTSGRTPVTSPRFHAAFWAAFRVPLEDGKARYLRIREPIRFKDLASEDPPGDAVEITRDYITDPDMDSEVAIEKIHNWVANNQLDLSDFLLKKKPVVPNFPPDDLLGRLIIALEPEELRRVSIPMDIVGKLRRETT